ncbi:unnamed protein product [Acanthoscelides obtectus]|uniref:Uncharacterized protein n=1 Tax=Acanthoscelides obtectus TaxID=200917 RepID=A0A9P0P4C8_ACAOB|nr:unnamed protein product [Acanthoscelides obtectus]CAK1634208.1 hypothetical protein AOBTE_LOCUS8663 [Acanthoscelides obtectus]
MALGVSAGGRGTGAGAIELTAAAIGPAAGGGGAKHSLDDDAGTGTITISAVLPEGIHVWLEILDAAAAEQYILSMCPLGSQHEHNDSENQPQNDFQSMWSMPHNENDSTIQPSINDMIWTKKKPSEMDNEATHLMLSLREEKSTYFDDKRTRKLKLWNDSKKVRGK